MTNRFNTLFSLVITILLFAGCGDNSTGPKPEPNPPEKETIIKDKAYVVDPDELSLSKRTDDKLSFTFTGQAPDIKEGDIVVGNEDGGFLRKVDAVDVNNNNVTLSTSEASLTDIVEKGNFHKTFNFSTDNLKRKSKKDSVNLYSTKWHVEQMSKGVSVSETGFNLDNTILYQGGEDEGNLKVTIPKGNITFNPKMDYDWKIRLSGIKEFHAIASGDLNVTSDIEISASKGIQLNKVKRLGKFGKTFVGTIGPVPVAVKAELSLLAGFDVDTKVKGTVQTGFSSNGSIKIGARYKNKDWTSINERELSGEGRPVEWEATANANIRAYIEPRIDLTLYTVAGPYVMAEPYLQFEGNATPPTWNWTLYRGLDVDLGFVVKILSYKLADFNKTLTNNKTKIASANSEDTFVPIKVQSLQCPSELQVDEKGNFSASVNDDKATPPISFKWNFGDETTAEGVETTKSYSSSDTYSVTFTASNDGSKDSKNCSVEVVEPSTEPTITSINATPNPSNTGETVNFSADISGDKPIDCKWDFGNGTTATKCNTTYTYQSTGTFDVSLKATNDGGSDTATLTQQVEQSGGNSNPNVIYVDADASGNNNGNSWGNAFTSLQNGLAKVEAGKEIWVAEGTYYPDQGAKQTEGDRGATFQLKNGVEMYGGFHGTEATRNMRDWENNTTTLSGDIGSHDEKGDNSLHVVTGSRTDNSSIIDGFIIRAGNANDYPDESGGGMYNEEGSPTINNTVIKNNTSNEYGGGIFNNNSNPKIINVVFVNNSVEGFGAKGGGAIFNSGSSPFIKKCKFKDNISEEDGGAVYNTNNSNPSITNTKFISNTADDGAGIYNRENSNPVIKTSIFKDNTSIADGGGIYNRESNPTIINVMFIGNSASKFNGGGIYNSSSSPKIINVLFTGNTAHSGGGIYNNGERSILMMTNCILSNNSASSGGGGLSNTRGDLKIVNSIIWGNSAPDPEEGQVKSFYSDTSSISYSIMEGGIPYDEFDGGHNLSSNPQFFDADGPDDIPGTMDDNLHLQSGSPAIDTGLNSALDLDGDGDTNDDVPVDLDGNKRIQNGTVDIGTYETGGN